MKLWLGKVRELFNVAKYEKGLFVDISSAFKGFYVVALVWNDDPSSYFFA